MRVLVLAAILLFSTAPAFARNLCKELILRCASGVEDCRNFSNEGTWELIWADEFTKDGPISTEDWTFALGGGGWWNNESQFYSDRLKNIRQENGKLVIEAHREDWEDHRYTSARIHSQFKRDFTYGRFEARVRLPKGRGAWPAFWMLASHDIYAWPDGSPACNGEIDIMEHVAFDPERIHHYIHTEVYNHWSGTQHGSNYLVPGVTDDFNTYRLDWLPDRLEFFVNGNLKWTYHRHGDWQKWPFDQDFYMLLNVAVGGWGGMQGIDDAAFPLRMEVDYVRVYAPTALSMCERNFLK